MRSRVQMNNFDFRSQRRNSSSHNVSGRCQRSTTRCVIKYCFLFVFVRSLSLSKSRIRETRTLPTITAVNACHNTRLYGRGAHKCGRAQCAGHTCVYVVVVPHCSIIIYAQIGHVDVTSSGRGPDKDLVVSTYE